ncbi:MAG: GNAT family N-acetyltransferase [Flavobacteriaceae bacterium]
MIRKALSSEIAEILSLTQACSKEMIANEIFQWNEHYPNVEAFQKDVKRGELYVKELENTLVGCMVISSLKDEEYDAVPWLTPDGFNYYIHRLAVHPAFQHQGHAKSLMDFAEKTIKEMGGISVRLDTFSKNARNQKFYEARGYTKLGGIYFPKQSEFPFYCYELII